MKTFKMRYYYMAPLIVLAMVACAKRDTDFAKKAAAAKEAAAQKPGTPGTDTSPTDNTTGTGRDGSAGTGTDTAKDKNGKPVESKKDGTYGGDLESTYATSCENKIAMVADADEEELVTKEVITKDKGSYVLQSTSMFSERIEKGSKAKNQVVLAGSLYELPKDFKTSSQDHSKILVNCHTIKIDNKSTQTLTAVGSLPYEISTEDGSIKIFRADQIVLGKTSTATTTLKASSMKFEDFMTDNGNIRKSIVVKSKDSSDITIKLFTSKEDDKGTVTTTISGVYSLKK